MKIYFIGGTSEYSSKIVDSLKTDYGFDIAAVGRTSGHGYPANKEKILSECCDYDVIINFTYAEGQQFNLLHDLYRQIKKTNWQGYLINFGSTVVLHGRGSKDNGLEPWQANRYHAQKKAVQEYGYGISKRFSQNKFRFTQIQCGMLANEKMKKLPNYRETCLQAENLSNILNYLINTPFNWHIHEFIIDAQ